MKSSVIEVNRHEKTLWRGRNMHVSLVKELDFKRNGKSLKGLLWSEYLCPPKIHGWKPSAQANSIRTWGLSEVIRSWGSRLLNRISAFIRGYREQSAVWKRTFPRIQTRRHSDVRLPVSRTARNKFLFCISYSLYSILLQHPQWLKTESSTWFS